MKQVYLILIYLVIILLQPACSKNRVPTCEECDFTCLEENDEDTFTNDCKDDWECSYVLRVDAKIDIEEMEGFKDGNKTVFQMKLSTEGSTILSDDGYTYLLLLELNSRQESFIVENAELLDMNAHFRRLCFCSSINYFEIDTGCIQGAKQLDGTWLLQGDITIPYFWGDLEVKFDAQFI